VEWCVAEYDCGECTGCDGVDDAYAVEYVDCE
jgi:hypothetical protein